MKTTLRSRMHFGIHTIDNNFTKILALFQRADLSVFHQFTPPPSGGGHQFLRALIQAAKAHGLIVENNSISHTTRACLFNSFNFEEQRLRVLRRSSVLYVHRVDGPIDTYRGRDEGLDRHIWQISQEFADKTIFQSQYSLEKHLDQGLIFKNPTVIMNAVDPGIFHSNNRYPFSTERKTRLIASSWSDNPKKGAAVYAWLDKNLDWNRYEFVFIGRSPLRFQNIRMINPLPSQELAGYLRKNDIYVTASQDDPCSNSLLEALSCGIPAIFLKSGGHPEIVKNAGLGFDSAEEIPALLEQISANYLYYKAAINIPSLESTALSYLRALELA
ncbi:MAG: glycosyltransferase family 4 protein [Chloroflexi bacterium]|nr:glycosyltransferase family 4 protein [Chloroflexota bacterium]